jgi:predicted RNA binding protein YcfA (HicA-like mRNA interferase family)
MASEVRETTAKELIRKLTAAGWVIIEGGGHQMATHPDRPGIKVPIHRHTGDIPAGTLNNILKATGLK